MSSLSIKRTCALLCLLLFFMSPGCRRRESWHTTTLLFFDTVCELKIHAPDSAVGPSKKDVSQIFSEIETLFSPGASLSNPLVNQLFTQSYDVYLKSEGRFDVSVAPLSRLWGFRSRSYAVPDKREILKTLTRIGLDRIKSSPEGLMIPDGMELDWGGVAKGFGIDRAVQRLRRNNISRGFLNAGGDLFCWGENPEEKDWRIGIQHPRREGFLGVLTITGVGAATTGDYQRFFIENGKRYHHVFDPKTGYPAQGKQSVTVIGPKTLLCDALSTALFVSADPEKVLASYPDYGAVLVDDKGIVTTIGRSFSLHLEP